MRSIVGPLALLISLSAAGCAEDSYEFEPTCDDGQCDELNGQDPAAFYQQLLYEIRDEGENLGTWHRYLTDLSLPVALPPVGTESCREGKVDLYLMANHQFILEYAETIPAPGSTQGCDNYVDDFKKRYEGQWRVEGLDLVVGNIGRGTGLSYNDSPALNFVFSNDLNSPGLTATNVLLNRPTSSWGLDECSGNSANASLCPVTIP